MKVAIDATGRLVIPKPLRELMHMEAGSPVDIQFHDGLLEVTVPSVSVRLVDNGSGPVAVPEEELPMLTARQVRETLEQERR
jgi:AbrB family looped-hinge helix DNA binding protein